MLRILVVTSVVLCFWVGGTSAHPHLFITTQFVMVFDDEGLHGIRVFWQCDEMYSVSTVESFDENADGVFNQEEAQNLADLAIESLADFGYFTHVKIDGVQHPVTVVENLKVTYEQNHLQYSFFVPCPVNIGGEPKEIKVAPYDKEYFAGMFFAEEKSVLFEKADKYEIETKIQEDLDTLIYFDMINPVTFSMTVSRR